VNRKEVLWVNRLGACASLGALLLAPLFGQEVESTGQSAGQQAQMQMPMPEEKPVGALPASEQMSGHEHREMTGMNHGMHMNEAGMYLMNMASGTNMNPQSWPMPMLMPRIGSWNLMLMGQAFVVDTQESGPRGGDKLYSPNAFMVSAEHSLGKGSLMLQSMVSLEAASVTNRSYPLLFQTGETAYGRPLVDAQHPHDFFMGLGVHYARPVGDTILQIYYAPVGDPALGPVVFPHRASAAELPEATLSHHWQDSTHIAENVATVAVKHAWFRLEASGFYGSEPGENRWIIEWGPTSSRAHKAGSSAVRTM
jgi:hypothetical protein